eukprot:190124_1
MKLWVVLYHNNCLAYYASVDSAWTQKDLPLGELSLYDVTNLIKKPNIEEQKYIFELVTQKRTFVFDAGDAHTYHAWINRISQRVTPTVIYEGWGAKRGYKNPSSWANPPPLQRAKQSMIYTQAIVPRKISNYHAK